MSLLIIKITANQDSNVQQTISLLEKHSVSHQVIDASACNIQPCTGCCACMLVTPGKCCIPDDCEAVIKSCLQYTQIVFITDTALGFIDHKAKNLIDRMFPLVNVLTRFHNEQILHIPRYDHEFHVGLIPVGDFDQNLLENWLDRFCNNMTAIPMGVFSINHIQELLKCIS